MDIYKDKLWRTKDLMELTSLELNEAFGQVLPDAQKIYDPFLALGLSYDMIALTKELERRSKFCRSVLWWDTMLRIGG